MLQIVDTPCSMPALLGEFERWMQSWSAAATTIEARIQCVRAYLDSAGARWREPTAVINWLSRPGLSPWSRYTYHAHLMSWFTWALDAGYIAESPMDKVRKPRVPKSRPRPLSQREVHALLTTTSRHPHMMTWLRLGLLEGLRAHEVAKFAGEDLTERSLHVLGKGSKKAQLPTHPEIWEIAQNYPRRGLWFPSPRDPSSPQGHRSVIAAVSRHFERAGVPGTFHRCRHTFGTNLLRQGVNIRVVQELMRHESMTSTAVYLAVDDDERTAAIQGLSA